MGLAKRPLGSSIEVVANALPELLLCGLGRIEQVSCRSKSHRISHFKKDSARMRPCGVLTAGLTVHCGCYAAERSGSGSAASGQWCRGFEDSLSES